MPLFQCPRVSRVMLLGSKIACFAPVRPHTIPSLKLLAGLGFSPPVFDGPSSHGILSWMFTWQLSCILIFGGVLMCHAAPSYPEGVRARRKQQKRKRFILGERNYPYSSGASGAIGIADLKNIHRTGLRLCTKVLTKAWAKASETEDRTSCIAQPSLWK
jgi:hypothetical protein